MTPLLFVVIAFAAAVVAGTLGSLLGIGGAILMTPILTMLGVPIHLAFGASIVCVLATSSGSAAAYVKNHMANFRTAILLELATTLGAITGAFAVHGVIGTKQGRSLLHILFGLVMLAVLVLMLRRKHADSPSMVYPDRWADKLKLHDHYYDQARQCEVHYRIHRTRLGLAVMYGAGILSGLLGIGSGAIAVPMLTGMGIPMKVATATSNVIMGVTAAASASIYVVGGQIDPFIAAPVCVGVLTGTGIGTRVAPYVPTRALRMIFVLVVALIALQMLKKGLWP